jgi:hypothetical protein
MIKMNNKPTIEPSTWEEYDRQFEEIKNKRIDNNRRIAQCDRRIKSLSDRVTDTTVLHRTRVFSVA